MKHLILALLIVLKCHAQQYFAPDTFSKFVTDWYSSQLTALQEEPLYSKNLPKGRETYRFTWLRSFNRPVALRLDVQPDGSGKFVIKVSDGAGGYKPGKIARNETRDVTVDVVKAVRVQFERAKFFDMPVTTNHRGLDGSEWILEAVVEGRYHLVERWTPREGPVFDIGMQFIELATASDFAPIY
jgi:hypothetical protein